MRLECVWRASGVHLRGRLEGVLGDFVLAELLTRLLTHSPTWSSMKKVPPAPRNEGYLEKTLAGVRVGTVVSSHNRTAITSMASSDAA